MNSTTKNIITLPIANNRYAMSSNSFTDIEDYLLS
nr:MAG TPA: hypothetical protein [Caudoviricetes sp.]